MDQNEQEALKIKFRWKKLWEPLGSVRAERVNVPLNVPDVSDQ